MPGWRRWRGGGVGRRAGGDGRRRQLWQQHRLRVVEGEKLGDHVANLAQLGAPLLALARHHAVGERAPPHHRHRVEVVLDELGPARARRPVGALLLQPSERRVLALVVGAATERAGDGGSDDGGRRERAANDGEP